MIKDAGYTVRISCLEEEDGGGWLAEIPELDGCFSDGDTPQEALQRLEEVFALWMQVAAEEGIMVPNPVRKSYSYSGKFTLRVPRTMHRALSAAADAEGISLNQYVVALLSFGLGERIGSSRIATAENAAAGEHPRSRTIVETRQQVITIENDRQYEYLAPLLSLDSQRRILNV